MNFKKELCDYLDTQKITSDNIGALRRQFFLPWESEWNGIVRDETAKRENIIRPSPSSRARHAIEVIAGCATLMKFHSVKNDDYDYFILQRTQSILNTIWRTEYWATQGCPAAVMAFWNEIHTQLVTQKLVYKFLAHYDATVNPPGQSGNVQVAFQPNNNTEHFILKLFVMPVMKGEFKS